MLTLVAMFLTLGAFSSYVRATATPRKLIVYGKLQDDVIPGVVRFDDNRFFYGFCGGVLISKNVVLTAKHCFKEFENGNSPVIAWWNGTSLRERSDKTSSWRSAEVESATLHPKYDKFLFLRLGWSEW